jgi:NAD(P)-dependent dehydrogenase (short-subunit alcohol dehydrogenase family)
MTAPLVDLRDLRLLVVGGGSGIGQSCVRLAAEAGAIVAATTMPGANETVPQAKSVRDCDTRDDGQVAAAVRDAALALGGIDAAIVTAGVFEHRGIGETAPEDWERVISINLGGPYRVARALAPIFEAQRGGSFVLFSSQIGLIGHRRATAYAASKGGVNALAKTLALEFAPFGARANAVAPGPIETPMTAIARSDPARAAGLVAAIPLGRLGQADEIARTALFLASPAASFITGHVLVADGGVTAA